MHQSYSHTAAITVNLPANENKCHCTRETR